MKKILFATLVALITLSFASCQGNNDPESKETITMQLKAVGTDTCLFSLTPSDTLAPYFQRVMDKREIAGLTKKELREYIKAFMDDEIAYFANFGGTIGYSYFCYTGAHEYTYYGLRPSTDYVVLACYMDTTTGAFLSGISKLPLRTEDIEVLGDKDLHMSEVSYQWLEESSQWMLSAWATGEESYTVNIISKDNASKTGVFSTSEDNLKWAMLIVGGAKIYEFIETTLTIREAENNTYAITMEGLATDGYRYHITFEPATLETISPEDAAPARQAPHQGPRMIQRPAL